MIKLACFVVFLCICLQSWPSTSAYRLKGYDSYDYIVIGGGAAGCSVAETISLGGKKVLLLERGPPRSHFPGTGQIKGWPEVIRDAGQLLVTKGGPWTITANVMGGATAFNGGAYFRENAKYWAQYGDMFNHTEIVESYKFIEGRLIQELPLSEYGRARIEACKEQGYEVHGYAYEQLVGVQQVYSTFDAKNGYHRKAADELLTPKPNLKVLTEATVTKIIFEKGETKPRATCVHYNHMGSKYEECVRAGGEIIVSAGAVWSPFLLMRSGLGEASHLRWHGVPVVADLPLIGKNLHDKPVINLAAFFPANLTEFPFTSIETSCGDEHGMVIQQTAGGEIAYAFGLLTLAFVPPHFRLDLLRKSFEELISGLPLKTLIARSSQLLSPLSNPYSRGEVRLKWDPNFESLGFLGPKISLNFFEDDRDMVNSIAILRKLVALVNTEAMKPWVVRKNSNGADSNNFLELASSLAMLLGVSNVWNMDQIHSSPDDTVVTIPLAPHYTAPDKVYEEWLRTYHVCSYHMAGSLEMGKVVDKDFKVMGVDGLRAVDASILPQITLVNPQGSIMMLGNYAGKIILREAAANAAASSSTSTGGSHGHDEL